MRRSDPKSTTKSFFRTGDRVFVLNGQWFFATREGEVGPFRSREAALKEVRRFVQERHALERFQRARDEGVLRRADSLAIVPKDEEPNLTLDDLILMESRR